MQTKQTQKKNRGISTDERIIINCGWLCTGK